MNPRPIPWPSRRERAIPPRAPTNDDEYEGSDLENICENYPELCAPTRVTRYPILRIPVGDVDDYVPAPVDTPSTRTRPTTGPRAFPAPSDFPYGTPGAFPDPYAFPSPTPAPSTPRALARRTQPYEPAFPWPDELLPFNRPRQSPRSRPARRTRPRTDTPRSNPLTPQQPLELGPTPTFTPTPRPDFTPLEQPQPQPRANDPCSAVEADKKREQRKKRNECKRFKWKKIRVCADSKKRR